MPKWVGMTGNMTFFLFIAHCFGGGECGNDMGRQDEQQQGGCYYGDVEPGNCAQLTCTGT